MRARIAACRSFSMPSATTCTPRLWPRPRAAVTIFRLLGSDSSPRTKLASILISSKGRACSRVQRQPHAGLLEQGNGALRRGVAVEQRAFGDLDAQVLQREAAGAGRCADLLDDVQVQELRRRQVEGEMEVTRPGADLRAGLADQVEDQAVQQSCPLGRRDEAHRGHRPQRGRTSARQYLEPDDLARAQVDLRLQRGEM